MTHRTCHRLAYWMLICLVAASATAARHPRHSPSTKTLTRKIEGSTAFNTPLVDMTATVGRTLT
jgi:hypothetical protein